MAKKRTGEYLNVDAFETLAQRQANLFELAIISLMPRDVLGAIKDRIGLALIYLEDGADITAIKILKQFLGEYTGEA